jgi:hypothetical protein
LLRSEKFANVPYVLRAPNVPSEQSVVVGVLRAQSAMIAGAALNTASHIASAEQLLPMANS